MKEEKLSETGLFLSVFTLMAGQGVWPLHIVQGESRNFKITYLDDLELFRAFLAARHGLQME